MSDPKEVLEGGNVTEGVVKVGDTVRRPSGPWTPFVHLYMCHVRDQGFRGVPWSLGTDEEDRHVVEWIEGEVTHPYQPVAASSPSVAEVGGLIRQLHDAAASFVPPADAVWNVVIAPDEPALIVHHDLAAWNFVHGADRAVFIDWDLAGPGSRLWDIAWAAHSFAGVGADKDPAAAATDLQALVDGYGLDQSDRERLIDLMPRRYLAMYELLESGHRDGVQPWARLWGEGHGRTWAMIADTASNLRDTLLRGVTGSP